MNQNQIRLVALLLIGLLVLGAAATLLSVVG